MKSSIVLLALVAVFGLVGCASEKPPPIKGHWAIDMDKTLRRAEDMGASIKARAKLMETYGGAQLHITDAEMALSIRGIDAPPISIPYSVISSDKNCSEVSITVLGKPGSGKLCIVDGFLEIISSEKKHAVEIYRRIS